MKYSIIIPTPNEEKLLPQLLEKLSDPYLKNNYDYEIIISDGGSKDGTLNVAKKYADKIIANDNKVKQNIAMGRNIGAQSAEGDLLIFYNGDVIPENLELVFKTIEKKFISKSYEAMTCFVKVFPEEQKIIDLVFQTFCIFFLNRLNDYFLILI